MESSTEVPSEVIVELTQILSNLVLGDNEIRSNAERAVDERLEQTPEVYLLALTQFATSADTEVMRSFSLVLLRRLLFRTSAATQQTPKPARLTLYDRLSSQTLTQIERVLLHSLAHEPQDVVRRKAVDTVADLANQSMRRGRPWHALQAQAFGMAQTEDASSRDVAFRLFAACPNLVMDLQTDAVLGVLKKGLQDPESVAVRLSALRASLSYLTFADEHQRAQSLSLLYPMLETLPPLPPAHLPSFLNTLTPLASLHPRLFAPHLPALLSFLPQLLLPLPDPGPTPTVARPFPSNGRAFSFPPTGESTPAQDDADEEAEEVRRAALEFMVSLSEARPSMVRGVEGWISVLVRGCLDGMGQLRDDELATWLDADSTEDPTDDTYPHLYEQALDRVACTLGGEVILPVAFQHIPGMLASHDWRLRHAGLMAIASVAEGTNKVWMTHLPRALITPMFSDSHPRVRYAACQCVGQLCTDLEEVIQAEYHQQLFSVLIPTLEAPEARVHAHAAAALINFCEGVKQETLVPYLDPIVERLLALLNPSDGSGRVAKRYVQEQAVTTLAMVADASEATFAKAPIMPLLLNILKSAEAPEYRTLRAKAMECAGLIAIAVGADIFRPDAPALVEVLMRIQNSPPDPGDALLPSYLIATWAKVCQAMGNEFEPYLPAVMPPLLRAASAKADVNILGDDESDDVKDGWELMKLDGQRVSVRTAAIEEKNQAFETLAIHCSTLGTVFAPYLGQTLELALPALRFYFHDGVREASSMLIPQLLQCGRTSNTLTNGMVTAIFSQLTTCISVESDATFLASLYDCYHRALLILGGPVALSPEFHAGIVEASKRQLHTLAERRKARGRPAGEDERQDMALLEEMEDFALEDMGRVLSMFEKDHPLLVAVSSVRDLGVRTAAWDEMEGESS
ncbi:ARM repeat-containing protein [Vararia minispora EC-137]|uniref:ARM repeat-containing protein n=1 Tax=Vararia minispora EC-137 TaxID=1314806 RepID=A0ACB8QK05_9AGAM|nr:ARM repeat-containing protein [Vararia minispora EC-137]